MASCSRILKMRLQYSFILNRKYQVFKRVFDMKELIIRGEKYYGEITPDKYDIVLGIDWKEVHRTEAVISNWDKYSYDVLFPLVDDLNYEPKIAFEYLKKYGIEIPLLYRLGFTHNNCMGRCFKGGQKHFKTLLENYPVQYAELSEYETQYNQMNKTEYSILVKTENKVQRRYPLKEMKENILSNILIDEFDVGGCGCFIDFDKGTDLADI